jgi:hypothetical protein
LGVLVHLRHKWITIEAIGAAKTKRCAICGKTKTRVG